MKEQRITIEISHEGKITADAEGFSGDACMKDLSRLLEGLAPGTPTVDRKADDDIARRKATRNQEQGRRQ
jgi:hypothetical protein